jgi:predicted transcriptional regulator
MNNPKMSFALSPGMLAKLGEVAEAEERSRSAIVRRAVREYLKHAERPGKTGHGG